ncbi:Uncharacterized protein SCF082_LOCUS14736 [Durusdinium trenchii]
MSLTETKPLPVIDTLRDEVERIYVKNKRQNAPETAPDVVALSWRIRKLLGFLKMKCRRREVSGVAAFQQLCMELDSSLQETVDDVNRKIEERKEARRLRGSGEGLEDSLHFMKWQCQLFVYCF